MPKNTHGHFGQLKHWAFLRQVFFSFLGENILVTQRENTWTSQLFFFLSPPNQTN